MVGYIYMNLCHGASQTLRVLNVYFEIPYRTLLSIYRYPKDPSYPILHYLTFVHYEPLECRNSGP